MSRKRMDHVPRPALLSALQNVAEDAPLWIGTAVNEGESFLDGLKLNRSKKTTKVELLDAIQTSAFSEFPTIHGHDDRIVITPTLYVYKDTINESQVFPATPGAEGYTYVCSKFNPYHNIYFRLDWEKKTVTFALGNNKKEVPIVENSGYCWRPTRAGLQCMSIEMLERDFLDEFWNPIAVTIGRKILGIRQPV